MGNYSLKNILLGIGIGLIIAAVLNISTGSREMTVEEIKKEAEKHNLIVLEKEEFMDRRSPENVQPPTPTAVPAASEDKVTISVKSGMNSEEIIDLLVEAGLLEDRKAFRNKLGELGVDSKLRVGDFEIQKDSSYDAIIKILTR